MADLKPCPFCGSRKLFVNHGFATDVECQECGASRGGSSDEEAEAAWNRRAQDVRGEAMREAAKICDGYDNTLAGEIRAAIHRRTNACIGAESGGSPDAGQATRLNDRKADMCSTPITDELDASNSGGAEQVYKRMKEHARALERGLALVCGEAMPSPELLEQIRNSPPEVRALFDDVLRAAAGEPPKEPPPGACE